MSAHEIELAKRRMQVFATGCMASLELAAAAERIGHHAAATRYRASAANASTAALRESVDILAAAATEAADSPRFQTASATAVDHAQASPCPFCASTEVHRLDITQHETGGRFICGALAQCQSCGAPGPEVDCDGDESERTAAAMTAWNSRNAPARVQGVQW